MWGYNVVVNCTNICESLARHTSGCTNTHRCTYCVSISDTLIVAHAIGRHPNDVRVRSFNIIHNSLLVRSIVVKQMFCKYFMSVHCRCLESVRVCVCVNTKLFQLRNPRCWCTNGVLCVTPGSCNLIWYWQWTLFIKRDICRHSIATNWKWYLFDCALPEMMNFCGICGICGCGIFAEERFDSVLALCMDEVVTEDEIAVVSAIQMHCIFISHF
jgi:hypothetical protein